MLALSVVCQLSSRVCGDEAAFSEYDSSSADDVDAATQHTKRKRKQKGIRRKGKVKTLPRLQPLELNLVNRAKAASAGQRVTTRKLQYPRAIRAVEGSNGAKELGAQGFVEASTTSDDYTLQLFSFV